MDQQITHLAEVVSSAFTALGVLLVLVQVRLMRKQAQTAFEDQLSREFRDTIHLLPAKVVLGAALTEAGREEHFDEIYRYLDLSNEQTFLRSIGRVSRRTWENWCIGIRDLLELPEFRKVWNEVKEHADSRFSELRRLEAGGFKVDPRTWT
jgi:hypothetical protein